MNLNGVIATLARGQDRGLPVPEASAVLGLNLAHTYPSKPPLTGVGIFAAWSSPSFRLTVRAVISKPENSVLGAGAALRRAEAGPRALGRFVRNFGLYLPLSAPPSDLSEGRPACRQSSPSNQSVLCYSGHVQTVLTVAGMAAFRVRRYCRRPQHLPDAAGLLLYPAVRHGDELV